MVMWGKRPSIKETCRIRIIGTDNRLLQSVHEVFGGLENPPPVQHALGLQLRLLRAPDELPQACHTRLGRQQSPCCCLWNRH